MKTKKYLRMIHLGLLCSLLSVSCRSYMTLKNKDFIKIDENFNGNYKSASVFIDSIKTKRNTNIQSLFGLKNNDSDLFFKINSKSELEIEYKNILGGTEKRFFKGKFRRKYFEIYLEKKRIPFAPIYSITSINRLRVAIDNQNNLVINHYENHSGMILLMAGGSSIKEQFIFKQTINK